MFIGCYVLSRRFVRLHRKLKYLQGLELNSES